MPEQQVEGEVAQENKNISYTIKPTAPCALCGKPAPEEEMEMKLDVPQTWGINYDKFMFSDLPVHQQCKHKHTKSSNTYSWLGVIAILGIVSGYFMGNSGTLEGLATSLFVGGIVLIIIWTFGWRAFNRKTFKKVESWATEYVEFS